MILARVDVSGSGFSGDITRLGVHRRLGDLETRDLAHVIRWVSEAQGSDEFQYKSRYNPFRQNNPENTLIMYTVLEFGTDYP